MEYTSHNEEETRALGARMGREAKAGAVFALTGDLGAGKTVFAKGFAEGLGITAPVTSPTFTLLQCYDGGRLPLYHFDLYRIEDASEADDIGCEEYFSGDGVCLVEWAERAEEMLPADCVHIRIESDAVQPELRHIFVSGSDSFR
ncbi:MAG: tRNA (adenosine(37)-N6)-threonylcarbamoyltransferase complex ATPase subunit type 1 TsaE [Lachnospiraceae bacterium]|nr:tRNA (adenosine(37)-N6)-threonylcarbamoyltransferase complex ATPase subunit type 1 TsaE [Lachnospiraceae bacterium]